MLWREAKNFSSKVDFFEFHTIAIHLKFSMKLQRKMNEKKFAYLQMRSFETKRDNYFFQL